MTLKVIKILLVILSSALLAWWVLSLIYGSLDLKLWYYRLIEPVLKY